MSRLFTGKQSTPQNNYQAIPRIDFEAQNAPQNYLCPEPLAAAVETAMLLGMPLLLTGEPGCGKSQLAYRVAWEMGFPGGKPLRYSVKSTTEAQDLFYTFDAVKRFQVAHKATVADEEMAGCNFIHYQALGLAILKAKGLQAIKTEAYGSLWVEANNPQLSQEPQPSVILIDEIDKAPRDVPNDILNEIEALSFRIPELALDKPIKLEKSDPRPLIIITSNSERELPEAFLRRCVYYHVGLPPFKSDNKSDVTVQSIIAARFQNRFAENSVFMRDALSFLAFLRLDERNFMKAPSLAEMLNWLDALDKHLRGIDTSKGLMQQEKGLVEELTATVLLKLKDDFQRANKLLDDWQKTRGKA